MNKDMIVRAWEDPEFRASLSAEQLAALPPNPSGSSMDELDESELLNIVGGAAAQGPIKMSGGYVCTLTTECSCPWSCRPGPASAA